MKPSTEHRRSDFTDFTNLITRDWPYPLDDLRKPNPDDTEFVEVKGFPQYMISKHGRVKNKRTNRLLKPYFSAGPRWGVQLTVSKGQQRKQMVDALVLKSWKNIDFSLRDINVEHIDGNTLNCELKNLRFQDFHHLYQDRESRVKIVTEYKGKTKEWNSLQLCAKRFFLPEYYLSTLIKFEDEFKLGEVTFKCTRETLKDRYPEDFLN